MRRPFVLALLLVGIFVVAGCTASGTYQKKVEEADSLAKDVLELKKKEQELILENSNLKTRVEALRLQVGNTATERDKFEKELRYVSGVRDKLNSDNQELDRQLKSKADAQSRTVGELRQKVSEMEEANKKLKEEVASLNRAADEKLRKMGESQGVYEKLRREQAVLQKALDEKARQLGDAQALAERIRLEGGKGQEDKARQLGELQGANEKLQQEISGLKKTAEGKDRQIEELQAENRKLTVDVAVKEKVEQLSSTYREMEEKMRSEIARGEVTITELKGKLTLNMADSILFESGKAEILSAGRNVLLKVAGVLGGVRDKQIRIGGHTDDRPITGALAKKYASNWELSAARAINVTHFLKEHGVGNTQIAAVAYAETRPVVSNDTPDGRARNRRIEINLVPKE